jgi:hypothetical protein
VRFAHERPCKTRGLSTVVADYDSSAFFGSSRGFRHPMDTQHSAVPRRSVAAVVIGGLGFAGAGWEGWGDAAAFAAPGLAAFLNGERGDQ